jgi:hypothetical protein
MKIKNVLCRYAVIPLFGSATIASASYEGLWTSSEYGGVGLSITEQGATYRATALLPTGPANSIVPFLSRAVAPSGGKLVIALDMPESGAHMFKSRAQPEVRFRKIDDDRGELSVGDDGGPIWQLRRVPVAAQPIPSGEYMLAGAVTFEGQDCKRKASYASALYRVKFDARTKQLELLEVPTLGGASCTYTGAATPSGNKWSASGAFVCSDAAEGKWFASAIAFDSLFGQLYLSADNANSKCSADANLAGGKF